MVRDDSDGDVRLRKSAHASLARLEAEVDRRAAVTSFRLAFVVFSRASRAARPAEAIRHPASQSGEL